MPKIEARRCGRDVLQLGVKRHVRSVDVCGGVDGVLYIDGAVAVQYCFASIGCTVESLSEHGGACQELQGG